MRVKEVTGEHQWMPEPGERTHDIRKIQLVLHQVSRRTTPERRIVGASTAQNVAVW